MENKYTHTSDDNKENERFGYKWVIKLVLFCLIKILISNVASISPYLNI